MSPKDLILRVHSDIMRHKKWCAVSGLLACGKSEVTKDVATACTDGWNREYNPEFIESLSREELRFVVLHEVAGHMAYQHMQVWRTLWAKNPRLTNIAADHFVNLALVDTDGGEGWIKVPKLGIQPEERFRGMSVGQIYKILEAAPPPPDKGQSMDEHEWTDTPPSEESSKVRTNEIERAMRQGEIVRRQMGSGSGGESGVFGELLSAKLDPRTLMRDFLTPSQGRDETSWRRVNRRFIADNVYMPSTEGVQMGELVVGMDTSGSCFGTSEMTFFVTEINHLIQELQPEKVHVVYWDSKVTGHQVFEGVFSVEALQPKGGGGTNGSVLFDYLRDKGINPQAVVQFSDGYVGDWGRADWPTMWVLTTDCKSPYGVTVNIKGD